MLTNTAEYDDKPGAQDAFELQRVSEFQRITV